MYSLLIGIFSILIGIYIWFTHEKPRTIMDVHIFFSIILIIFGGILFLLGLDEILLQFDKYIEIKSIDKLKFYEIASIYLFIFLGSICYTIASFFHLKMKNWSFLKALLIAIPFVLIEYQFSLRGNMHARIHLELNAVQITLITMTFYFINAWLLNFFILNQPVIWWKEVLAFLFICIAFLLTTKT